MKKTFDCVALQHEGGCRVQEATAGMSPQEQAEYWRRRAEAFQKRRRARKNDELPPILSQAAPERASG